MSPAVRYGLAIVGSAALGLGLLALANVAYWWIVDPMAEDAHHPEAVRVGEAISVWDSGFFYRAGAAFYSMHFLILLLGVAVSLVVVRVGKVPWPLAGLSIAVVGLATLWVAALGEFSSACLLGRPFFSEANLC